MKYLIMCEGSNEKKLIELLLDNNKLTITYDDLVGMQVYHARQIKTSVVVKTQLKIYGGDFEIWRIGDKQTDRLLIPNDLKSRVLNIKEYCTLPELESLLIISEGLWKDYLKTKTNIHPKEYALQNIQYNKKKYKGDTKFYEDYYGQDVQKLVDAIRKYKQLNGAHDKKQHYWVEFLNKDE